MFRFNRSQLFWYGILVIGAAFALYKCYLLITWQHTIGTMVAYDVALPNGTSVRIFDNRGDVPTGWSVIQFHANGEKYDFIAGENLGIAFGSRVPVLYSPHHPTKAFVNTFFGLWFRPLMVLPLMLWAAVVTGLTGKNSYWTVRTKPFSVARTDIQKRLDA